MLYLLSKTIIIDPTGVFLFQTRGMSGLGYAVFWIALKADTANHNTCVVALQLKVLRGNITSAIQQQLVQMVLDGRMFFIDHPELGEGEGETEFERFVASNGGWGKYLMRRNVINTLELLYFQRKSGSVERAFFVSHCNHLRAWFANDTFRKTWEFSRTMHVEEFGHFVDRLLASGAQDTDPYRSMLTRVVMSLRRQRRG